ncbi:MAG: HD family phosphohydrolase [Candidatus Sumerlaeaceae bacterium]
MGKLVDRARRTVESRNVAGRSPKSPLASRLDSLMRWATVIVVWLGLVVIVGPIPRFTPFRAEVGQEWTEGDVVTPFALAVEDTEQVARDEAEIRSQHAKIFVHDVAVEHGTVELLERVLNEASKARNLPSSQSVFQKKLRTAYGVELSHPTCEFLIAHADDPRLHTDLLEVLRTLYSERGITNDKRLLIGAALTGRLRILSAAPSALDRTTTFDLERVLEYPTEVESFLERRAFARAPVAPEWRKAYTELLLPILRPNIVYSEHLTAESLEAALKKVQRKFEVAAGNRVITRGERLSSLQVELLGLLDKKLRRYDTLRLFSNALIVALAMAFVAGFAARYVRDFLFTPARIAMLALPSVFALAVGKFVFTLSDDVVLSTFAYPAGLVGMLDVILFEPQLAIVISLVSALAAGLAFHGSFWPTFVGAVSGLAGVVFLHSVRERREVLMAGLRLAALNALLAIVSAVMFNRLAIRADVAILAVANGLACYVLAVGGLPLIESLFGIVTDVRLMELTSIEHPLMRLMEERAPGSYQHVLNVTKLAEPAAERIGANYLLVRAGAYFHDVGKLLKPKYYTENQVTPEERRIHSRMSPFLSCLIIKNHVREGIELARRFRLPQQVIDFIPQHHGTSLIKYFYEQARQQLGTQISTLDEEEFRYPGPKPQTREAAIVMLADAVEATATAKLTGKIVREEDVYRLVRQTIQDKFSDGQFDECKMTFEDLHEIFEVFVKTLLSRYHRRVDYPQPGQARSKPAGTVVVPEPAAAPMTGQNS